MNRVQTLSESTLMTEDNELIKQKVREVVRHAAQERMALHARNDRISLQDCVNRHGEACHAGQVLGNHMALILVTGDALRLTLKLHFSTRDVKKIAYPVYGLAAPELLSPQQATDFMKELCNLTAGYIVQIFEERGMPLGISLPLCTRGFCELFADYSEADDPIIRYFDQWNLEVPVLDGQEVRIYGTVMTEILDKHALENIRSFEIPAMGEDEDEGEIDFL